MIVTCARRLDVELFQCRQRFLQAGASPIEDMVVGQHATVDPGGRQTFRILGAHAVVDGFVGAVVAAGHGRFKIDDPRIRLHSLQLVQCSGPKRRTTHCAAEWDH
jgi:hypothetical protein